MDSQQYFSVDKFLLLCFLCLFLLISYILYSPFPTYNKLPMLDPELKLEKSSSFLTIEEAKNRSNLISNISYSLFLFLSTEYYFTGEVIIIFDIKEPSENLFLDFEGVSINTFKMNGNKITQNLLLRQGKIYFPKIFQKEGINQISIIYSCNYSHDGEGMHIYQDLKSSQTFLYTHFEPYKANRAFPNFDQPDLKATFKISILAKDDWVIASNEKIWSKKNQKTDILEHLLNQSQYTVDNTIGSLILKGGLALTNFKKTPRISTYMICIIAGNYLSLTYNKTDFYIPMTIYYREPMEKYINKVSADIFTLIKEGIKYFADAFSYPFPFTKYDQIFVPEFNSGAMENAGLVTFNEIYIQKETFSQIDYGLLGEVVIHELSHMWFGNLVTLKWWDDTWLNEAMATFLTNICIEESLNLIKYKEQKVLNYIYLTLAYDKDQMPSNHKISAVVENTDQARIIFDLLTYKKGSAVLMQLYKIIGKDSFWSSISNYIRAFKWSNANRDDFISSFNESKNNLNITVKEWFDEWIEKKGINLFIPNVGIDDKTKKITNFQIEQKTQENGDKILRKINTELLILLNNESNFKTRDQDNFNLSKYVFNWSLNKINVYLPNNNNNKKFIMTAISINNSTITKLPDDVFKDLSDPQLILLNPEGNTYALTYLDYLTVNKVLNLGILPDNSFHTIVVLQSLINMVKGKIVPANDLLNWIINYINKERDLEILTFILRKLNEITHKCISFDSRIEFGDIISANMYNLLLNEKDPIYANVYAKFLYQYAISNKAKILLYEIFLKNHTALELLDNDLKYSMICKIFSLESVSLDYKYKLMENYILKDKTGLDEFRKKSCEASLPDMSFKEKLWEWYNNDTLNSSVRIYEYSMSHFFNLNNMTFFKHYAKRFSENVINIFKTHNSIFAKKYFELLSPKIADNESLTLYENLIKNDSSFDIQLYNKLQDSIYEMKNSISCIEFDNNNK